MVDTQDTPLATEQAVETEQSEDKAKATTPADAEQPEAEAKTDDADETTDEVDESEDEQDDEPKPKKQSGSARLKARLAEAQAEIDRLRRFVPAKSDAASIQQSVEAELGPRPKESDYSDYLAYERAVTAYETASLLKRADFAREATRREQAEADRVRYVVESHKEREAEARKAIPDYDATIRSATFPVSHELQRQIIESDKSAEVLYYLAKRPNLVNELNSASPVEIAKRIGRIEATAHLPKPKTVTKAPAPTPSLKGGASPTPDVHKMNSMKDYAKIRLKELGYE